MTYFDDGLFKIRVFGKGNETIFRADEQKDLEFNSLLGIDDSTEAIDNFPDPMCCCCFISDTIIFVNIFHN